MKKTQIIVDCHDWKTIHKDMDSKTITLWMEKNFSYWDVMEWMVSLDKHFEITDVEFCAAMRRKRLLPKYVSDDILTKLKIEWKKDKDNCLIKIARQTEIIKWNKIDNKFSQLDLTKKPIQTFQERWEHYGLTSSDASNWLHSGFTVEEYRLISEWIWYNTNSISYQWYAFKSIRKDEYDLVSYLKNSKFLWILSDLDGLRKEFQNWKQQPKSINQSLEILYLKENHNIIKTLDFSKHNVTGNLSIDGKESVKLEEVTISRNHDVRGDLESVSFDNCSMLEKIICFDRGIKNINISFSCPNLSWIDASNNNLKSNLVNLGMLTKLVYLNVNNNSLSGSLHVLEDLVSIKCLLIKNNNLSGHLGMLKNLDKLNTLDIRGNKEISSLGWDLLTNEMERLYCDNDFIAFSNDYKKYSSDEAFYDYQALKMKSMEIAEISTYEYLG